jgi:uncharacterized protein (TIGR03437 family)
VRPNRPFSACFLLLLLGLAAGSLRADVLVSLGTSTSCGTLSGAQNCTLTARVTGLADQSVTWSFSPTVVGATLGNPVGPDATGQTTRVYTAPNLVAARQTVIATVTASDGVTRASAQITLVPPSVSVVVSPASVTLLAGQTQKFSATVLGISNSTVTWSISPQTGTIDSTGNYTAPPSITTSSKVTVTATSNFDGTSAGNATVNLTVPAAVSVTISPTSVTLNNGDTQQFTATVTNAANTGVLWSMTPTTGAGTLDSSGLYTAPSTITVTKATVTAQSLQDPAKTASATVTLATQLDVGTGAPTDFLVSQFQGAYNRNGFQFLTSLPPLGQVKVLGAFSPTAYVQEFPDAAKTSGVKYALATGSPTTTGVNGNGTLVTVYQIWSDVYAYYTTVGASTAGLPLSDTSNCPFIAGGNTCTYQSFDKNYILFVYKQALPSGLTNVFIRNASTTSVFNTEWNTLGGLSGPGNPLTAESATQTGAVIAPATAGTTYIVQTFAAGAIYALTSGVYRNTIHGVVQPFYDLYIAAGGPSGKYGLPIGEIESFSSGLRQQRFEGGIIQVQADGGPTGQLPVVSVLISGSPASGAITLNLGSSVNLTATPRDSTGTALAGRPVTWASTNGKVLQIQASGLSATVTAIGGGTANVTASSGGVTSLPLTFVVAAQCCQVGDGAPSTVQAAFQNAVLRNKLSIQVPVASPAQRVGAGYVQIVQATGASPVLYLLALADQVGSAYVISGALLAAYQGSGGPAGSLGYPTSDASPAGTQLFSAGQALSGSPVHLVSDPILGKWAFLKYDSGIAGVPTGEAAGFSTIGANSGVTQNFATGAIYSATAGPRSGQSYFVTGLVLSTYNSSGGASGNLGMPVSDEFVTGGLHQQNFEGGNISYSAGATAAQTQLAPKVPAVIVAPASISAGGRARVAVAGFANGATIQVAITGQQPFNVTSATGAYSWDMYIPLSSTSQTLSIHAVDAKGSAAADGTLVIRGFADNRVLLTKIQGDNQTAAPGALLPIPLQVALMDAAGTPVAGANLSFQAYPGVQLSAASAMTDAAGHASVSMRLPATLGTAGVTVSAPSIAQSPVTFYALASATSLPNFPSVPQSGSAAIGNGTATIAQKGALLTSVASILRYYQNLGAVPSPNGLADPTTLNQFLTKDCTVDASGSQLCDGYSSSSATAEQVVNLWRAADFTGGLDVIPATASVGVIADLVAQGEPLLLSLSVSLNGSLYGGHFVVATGIANDGSIVIQDPNPFFARTNLNDYLNGFSGPAGTWTGALAGVARFAVRPPSVTRFLLGAISQPPSLAAKMSLTATSPAGACGPSIQMIDTVDSAGNAPSGGALVSTFLVCDGLQSSYQVDVGAGQSFHAFATDLGQRGGTIDLSGNSPTSYQASRPLLNLALIPLAPAFNAAAVVNAATFTAGISPGGLFSIFGSGLSGQGTATVVDFDGTPAPLLAASPFQINGQVPTTMSPGSHVLRVKSAFGITQQTVTVSAVSPGIFMVGVPSLAAIENYPDGSLNAANNPVARGQALIVFATGLGAVTKQSQFSITATPVTALLNGVEMPVSFAGLAPGFVGLYQVNLPIPAATAPGLGISLTLKQAGQLSNTVFVSLK